MNRLDEETRGRLIESAHNYNDDEMRDFISERVWEDWMDCFVDGEEPTEKELSTINKILEDIFIEAHTSFIVLYEQEDKYGCFKEIDKWKFSSLDDAMEKFESVNIEYDWEKEFKTSHYLNKDTLWISVGKSVPCADIDLIDSRSYGYDDHNIDEGDGE